VATETEVSGDRSGFWRSKFVVEERYVSRATRSRLYATSAILIALGAVLFVTILIGVLQHSGVTVLDRPVERWMNADRTAAVTLVMTVLTIAFGPVVLPIIVLIVTVLWVAIGKHAWRPLLLAGAMIAGVGVANLIAYTIQRHRPPTNFMLIGNDTTFSFPSGHVLGASDFLVITAFLIISRAPKIRRVLIALPIAWLGVLLAMFSRMYLGYHWFSDTLASLTLSCIIVGAVIAIDTWRTVRVAGEPVTGALSQPQADGT
jgi:membrane-associated phospholipid phosphatase